MLPEQPEEKPPFEFQCPVCFANDYTASPNANLIICKSCGAEMSEGESTRPMESKAFSQPNKDTKPFKDGFDRLG